MNNTRISQIHREIEKLKRAKEDTDVQFTLDAIDEEIDEYEKEICKLLDEEDEEEPTPEEQDELSRQLQDDTNSANGNY